MIELTTRNGRAACVPETIAEDTTPRFAASEMAAIRRHFAEQGFVIVTGLVPPDDTGEARRLWNAEIKPYRGPLYRQASAKLERHRFNERGWVMNPILNLQSLDPKRFAGLRSHTTQRIFPALRSVFSALLGEGPKIVQSMFFEGNSATWEHRDSDYLDSECIGSMIGAWIALEDIAPRAGRFFVVPGSHQNQSAGSVVNHDAYVHGVVGEIAQVCAPALRQGDVLFWNSLTIHGSLDSQDQRRSRSSITCHAIPASHRFMQFRRRVMEVPTEDVGGVQVYAPKDQARLRHRAVRAVEATLPGPFYTAKKAAVKILLR